jgi:hypothetical protein
VNYWTLSSLHFRPDLSCFLPQIYTGIGISFCAAYSSILWVSSAVYLHLCAKNVCLYCNVLTPKWPPSWIINLKTSGRRFQVCYAQKRCADRGTAPLRTGLSWEINRLSRIRRSHSEVPDDRILKSEAETGCLCTCLWASGWDGAFLSSQRRDVSACLANIQCATALTRELIHNMWSHSLKFLIYFA